MNVTCVVAVLAVLGWSIVVLLPTIVNRLSFVHLLYKSRSNEVAVVCVCVFVAPPLPNSRIVGRWPAVICSGLTAFVQLALEFIFWRLSIGVAVVLVSLLRHWVFYSGLTCNSEGRTPTSE